MKNSPYKVDSGSKGFLSALGSGAVAVGSVATAIVVVVPGMPGYEMLSDALASPQNNFDIANSQGRPTESATPGEASVLSNANSVAGLATSSTNQDSSVSAPAPSQSKPGSADSKDTSADPAPQLSLPGVDQGNTSSPTPGGGSYTPGTGGSGSESGNTSSPTPGGGSSEYEEDDEDDEHDEEDHDEREDDHDEDDD